MSTSGTSRSDDFGRAAQLVRAAGGQDHAVHLAVVDGDPISKARARFAKGHTYTPKATVEGEARIAQALAGVEKHEANVAVACIFYRRTLHRVDVDNLLKAVLDGATKAAIWDDDSQVTAILGVLEHDPDAPRTIIAVATHSSTMLRGLAATLECEVCGTRYKPGGKRRAKARYCSRACATRLAAPVDCEHCGEPFRRKANNQRFCSHDCRLARLQAGHRTRGPKPTCKHCGKELSRHGYEECRECFESGVGRVAA